MGAQQLPQTPVERGILGQYLWDLRQAVGMTLREVEDASGKEISNAYLSQLENGKITSPSPAILHELAEVYGPRMPKNVPLVASYERLMELAGHIRPADKTARQRQSRLPTFATETLSADEEEELLKYLGYLRLRKGRQK